MRSLIIYSHKFKRIISTFLLSISSVIMFGCSSINNADNNLALYDIYGSGDSISVKVFYQEGDDIISAVRAKGKGTEFVVDAIDNIDCGLQIINLNSLKNISKSCGFTEISDFFDVYGQPIKIVDDSIHEYLIMDGWPSGKQEFYIISNDDGNVISISKKNFDEICINVSLENDLIKIYTGWCIYSWNQSDKSTCIYEYIPSEAINCPEYYDIFENKLSEYKIESNYDLMITNCFKLSNTSPFVIDTLSIITLENNGILNHQYQDHLCISSIIQDEFIYTIGYMDSELCVTQYSLIDLTIIKEYEIKMPQEIDELIQFSIDVTPRYIDGTWYSNFASVKKEDEIYSQYIVGVDILNGSLNYIGKLNLSDSCYFKDVIVQ